MRKIILMMLIIGMIPAVTANINVEAVSFDPGVITAGDRVNITTTLHERMIGVSDETRESLNVRLAADNRLAREQVVIEQDRDTPIYIPEGGRWNQRFSVRVEAGAPTGEYDFDVIINSTTEKGEQITRASFTMPVDRSGVDISGHITTSEPRDIRPDDNNARLDVSFANTGNKPIEEITMIPDLPKHITPSFSEDEKIFINRLGVDESIEKPLSIDIDDRTEPGRKTLVFNTTFEDRSGNTYQENLSVPIRIEDKPTLDIQTESVNVTAGRSNQVAVEIKNTGGHAAEGVSARTILERFQPLNVGDRSTYIGTIEPNETRTALFDVNVDQDAVGIHQLKLDLRATGDSEEGDSSVYTWTETTDLRINGETTNWLLYLGLTVAAVILAILVYRRVK